MERNTTRTCMFGKLAPFPSQQRAPTATWKNTHGRQPFFQQNQRNTLLRALRAGLNLSAVCICVTNSRRPPTVHCQVQPCVLGSHLGLSRQLVLTTEVGLGARKTHFAVILD